MNSPRHRNSFECPACDEKLRGVDPELVLFAHRFRGFKQDAHVSWGFRGKEDQEAFLRRGTSRAAFGESPHNYGLAIDFFRLTQAGGASFDATWYERFLAPAAREAGFRWGGDFRSFRDLPHVEIKDWRLTVKK